MQTAVCKLLFLWIWQLSDALGSVAPLASHVSPRSAVPVGLLSSPFLRTTHCPAVSQKDNPLWHRILSPTAEKNEEWLHRTTMAFTARLDAKRVAGKTPKLRGGAAAQYRDADPAQVHQLASLWLHIKPDIQLSVDATVFQRLEGMFRRGALDRELLEKVKVRDPQLTIANFRFMMNAQQDAPAQVSHASQLTMSSAELAVKKANFNLWKATLENECKRFTIFQQQKRNILEAGCLQQSHQQP